MGRWLLALLLIGCGSEEAAGPPPCDSFENGIHTLIPGPGQAGYDEALAAKAHGHDRMFIAVHSHAAGLNADFTVSDRAPFDLFARSEGYDFEAATGAKVEDLGEWHKVAGLYGGVGAAADAYRYGALRDEGAGCAEIEVARSQLVRSMEAMDRASRINGVPGVNSRGVINLDLPASGYRDPTPLFDDQGMPLPPEKNNGEWRADQTGDYGNFIWEDSCSRDMLVGWAMAYGAVWEVVKDDETISADLKTRLSENAAASARALMKVGESGYDLEIPDADGRLTLHSFLNENAVDRLYLDGAENGFNAIMALGIVGAFAYAAEDAEIDSYLYEDLVTQRKLQQIADKDMLVVNVGVGSNFSNYNMAFTGMYLAQRYVDHVKANQWLVKANREELYAKEGSPEERRPSVLRQSFFDLIFAAGEADAKANQAGVQAPADAVSRAVDTLSQYPDAPYWNEEVINCDEAELASGTCVLLDGTTVRVLGEVGWKGTLVSEELVPMAVRPPSNYHWRSDPHRLNGGGGNGLLPSVDFRVAYWMGRFIRVD